MGGGANESEGAAGRIEDRGAESSGVWGGGAPFPP